MKKRPLLIIEWQDITTATSWADEDTDFTKDALDCVSVGWKLQSTRKHIVIASMRTHEGRVGTREIIPKGNIKSIRRVE